MPLEGLCDTTNAKRFYFAYAHVYELLQPFFTSNQMRNKGLQLANVQDQNLKVLDVGAGTGTLSLQMINNNNIKPENLTLVDQSSQMLKYARRKPQLEGATIVCADAHFLPFESQSFDRVVSSGVIYYFPRPVDALREQMRVLRPGGIVLAMGSLQPRPFFVRLIAQTFNRFPTEEQYREWFCKAGFTDIRTERISNPWNSEQYALAICGTRPESCLTVERPDGQSEKEESPLPALGRLLRLPHSVASFLASLARFGISMAAFSILGPLQIINASLGMRRLRRQEQLAMYTGE